MSISSWTTSRCACRRRTVVCSGRHRKEGLPRKPFSILFGVKRECATAEVRTASPEYFYPLFVTNVYAFGLNIAQRMPFPSLEWIRTHSVSGKCCPQYQNAASSSTLLSSGVRRCVIRWKFTDVSENRTASVFSVEVQAEQPSGGRLCLQPTSLLVTCFSHCLTPWKEEAYPSEESVNIYKTTRRLVRVLVVQSL